MVILGSDRVVEVVVTAGTGNREAKKSPCHSVDTILPFLCLDVQSSPIVVLRTQPDEAKSRKILFPMVIGSQLQADKLVKSEITIKGGYHPLPVLVRVRIEKLPIIPHLMRLVFRIPHDRQPHAGQTLPKLRACQQPIHELFVCLRLFAFQKALHLINMGRQTREIKTQPPEKGSLSRLALRLQPRIFKPSQNEPVQILSGPLLAHHLGQGTRARWLERPEFTRLLPDDFLLGEDGKDPYHEDEKKHCDPALHKDITHQNPAPLQLKYVPKRPSGLTPRKIPASDLLIVAAVDPAIGQSRVRPH